MGKAPGKPKAWLAPGRDGVTRDNSLNATGRDIVEVAPACSMKCHIAPMK